MDYAASLVIEFEEPLEQDPSFIKFLSEKTGCPDREPIPQFTPLILPEEQRLEGNHVVQEFVVQPASFVRRVKPADGDVQRGPTLYCSEPPPEIRELRDLVLSQFVGRGKNHPPL